MSVSQAEYVSFKDQVLVSIAKLEAVVTKSNADATAAMAVISELQQSYSQISLQAAPWSAAIQAEVSSSEAKATGALAEVRALHEATKAEVEDLRRRASEVEKRSTGEKKDQVGTLQARGQMSLVARKRLGPGSRKA